MKDGFIISGLSLSSPVRFHIAKEIVFVGYLPLNAGALEGVEICGGTTPQISAAQGE
ncbi:MAG: hypothetical protein JW854_11175 [Actinobacteria bacterium]|nr:hypothetical protein [Actinomycetota bacterium]